MTQTMNLQSHSPGSSLGQYIEIVKRMPVLSKEEELALATRFHQDNDLEAARKLVMAHLRHVVYIAHGYMGYGLPLSDLVQEGNVGLMKAVKNFDAEHNVRLMTFATHWIKAEIQEFVLKNWRVVKVATTKAQRKLFFNLRKSKGHLGWFSQDETHALADKLGVDADTVTQMEQRLSAQDVAFDTPKNSADDDETQHFSPSNQLSCIASSPLYQLEKDDTQQDEKRRLEGALLSLDERSREIVSARWLADKKVTLVELAERYQVSAERIRQLETQAFKKLKKVLALRPV